MFSAFEGKDGKNETFDVVFFNIPWNSASQASKPKSRLSEAIYGARELLGRFLADLPSHLTPIGSGYLTICLDAEHECLGEDEFMQSAVSASLNATEGAKSDFVSLIRLDPIKE